MWILGDSLVRRAHQYLISQHKDPNLGLHQVEVMWIGEGGMHVDTLSRKLESYLGKHAAPDVLIIHCGSNDLTSTKNSDIISHIVAAIDELHLTAPNCLVLYSDILPRRRYLGAHNPKQVDLKRKCINRHMKSYVQYPYGISHPQFTYKSSSLILGFPDWVHLTSKGYQIFIQNLSQALYSIL